MGNLDAPAHSVWMVKPLSKPRVATAEAPYHDEEIEPGDSSGSEEATFDDPTRHIFSSQTASSLHRSHRYLSDAEAVRDSVYGHYP